MLIGVGIALLPAFALDAPLWLTHPVAVVVSGAVLMLGAEVFVRWSGRRLRLDD